MTTDTIGRAVALVAGVISTACALGILLEDVWLGKAAFALKHALTIGVVALGSTPAPRPSWTSPAAWHQGKRLPRRTGSPRPGALTKPP